MSHLLLIGILGAVIGSFLSMLVYRLPRIMQRQWRSECQEFLGVEDGAEGEKKESLWLPRSHCPHCSHPLRLVDNIPVIGFLLNRGHCNHCNHPIGWRYLTIELLAIAVAITATLHFDQPLHASAAMGFGWILLALLFIDLEHQLLPDPLTQILLWSGLLVNQWDLFAAPSEALWGAVAGYLALWMVFHLYRLVTGCSGMGGGDLKLFAALGAWCGWLLLPQILLIASLSGIVVGIPFILSKRKKGEPGGIARNSVTPIWAVTPIPFGPFLALGGWIALLWGGEINRLAGDLLDTIRLAGDLLDANQLLGITGLQPFGAIGGIG